jgi:hypothetical protein
VQFSRTDKNIRGRRSHQRDASGVAWRPAQNDEPVKINPSRAMRLVAASYVRLTDVSDQIRSRLMYSRSVATAKRDYRNADIGQFQCAVV